MTRTQTAPFYGIAGAVRLDKRLFIACGLNGLKVFELKGNSAELVASLTNFPAFDLALRDGFIAIAAGNKGVVLLDAQNLRPIQTLTTNFPVHSITWNKGKLVAHSASIGNNQSLAF